MPGSVNGVSLAWEIKNRSPNTPVTLISGRANPSSAELPEGVVFVAKPCSMNLIVEHAERMIAQTLGQAASNEGAEGNIIHFERKAEA